MIWSRIVAVETSTSIAGTRPAPFAARTSRIEITARQSGDRIVATVRDTGAGIPPDALTRIFEPFYTTKDVGQGTGLGLAITYGIVQEHGGDIHAANVAGGGALFTIDLPAS